MAMSSPAHLTLENAAAVAQGWLIAFDNADACEAILRQHEYQAFDVYRRFIEQFAVSGDDVATHRICYRESRKQHASVRVPGGVQWKGLFYRSLYLETLKTKMANKMGFQSTKDWKAILPEPASWQLELDPLLREQSKAILSCGTQDIRDHYRTEFEDQARLALEQEAHRFSPDAAGSFAIDEKRLSAFQEFSASQLGPIGFKVSKSRFKNYAALDKELSDDWILRWSIGDCDSFFLEGYPSICRPTLHLRHRSFKRRLRDWNGDTMTVEFPFHFLVEGFAEVYKECRTIPEMKVIVAASALVLEWALPYILSELDKFRIGVTT